MKKRYLKTFLKIILSAIILLLILIALGIIYTKYSGGQEESAQPVPQPPARPIIKPPKLSPKAKESVAIQTISSPVKRGSEASISIKTNPKSKCQIKVEYKDETGNDIEYRSSALIVKKADEFGIVEWDWPISSSAPAGKWEVTVTCFYNKKSALVIGDMLVK